MIGYAFCGSFCTFDRSIAVLKELVNVYDVLPIMSHNAASTDTRFGKSDDFIKTITEICRREPILTIKDAEPLGPALPLDALVIAPCTGNTLAKIALGITDTPVTMAAKAHLRNEKPLVIALASNDAMSANFKNLAELISRKNVYFVPLTQDDPVAKPSSLVADFSKIEETLECALRGSQIRPLFL